MKSQLWAILGCCVLALAFQSWGFFVHRHIHAAAVSALPDPLRPWFEQQSDWLTEHAVDADKRKRMVEREAPKHYLDLDAPALNCLQDLGSAPWWSQACEVCSEDTLWAYGVLPWNIQWTYRRLVEAMHDGDAARILRHAADLGHYVGDAHVPLHTTLNYNGQLTGQEGIHGLWETRLPELYGGRYLLAVPEAEYIGDVGQWAWEVVHRSHAAVDSVLAMEAELVASWSRDLVVREERGRTVQLQRVEPWCSAYHDRLGGMVERQWRAAIHGVASVWWSAWVDAGQPDLEQVLGANEACGWWRRVRGRCEDHDGNP